MRGLLLLLVLFGALISFACACDIGSVGTRDSTCSSSYAVVDQSGRYVSSVHVRNTPVIYTLYVRNYSNKPLPLCFDVEENGVQVLYPQGCVLVPGNSTQPVTFSVSSLDAPSCVKLLTSFDTRDICFYPFPVSGAASVLGLLSGGRYIDVLFSAFLIVISGFVYLFLLR